MRKMTFILARKPADAGRFALQEGMQRQEWKRLCPLFPDLREFKGRDPGNRVIIVLGCRISWEVRQEIEKRRIPVVRYSADGPIAWRMRSAAV